MLTKLNLMSKNGTSNIKKNKLECPIKLSLVENTVSLKFSKITWR